MCVMESICRWVQVSTKAKHQIPLELELQAVVSCLMWMLRGKLISNARAVSPLTDEPPLQACLILILKF